MAKVRRKPGTDRAFKVVENLDSILAKTAKESREDLGDAIFFVAQKTVPIDESTLLHSGYVRHEKKRTVIGYTAPYAKYVHEGTGTHIGKPKYPIVPKRGKALRFEWKGTKKARRTATAQGKRRAPNIWYFKKVMHPGIKGTKWLRNAAKKMLPKYGFYFSRNFKKNLEGAR